MRDLRICEEMEDEREVVNKMDSGCPETRHLRRRYRLHARRIGTSNWRGDCIYLHDISLTLVDPFVTEDLMKHSLKFSALSAASFIVFVSACAQVPPPPAPGAPVPPGPGVAPPPPPPPQVFVPAPGTVDPNQLPETRGTVQRFTLTPIGEIDGVILTDGTEVHLPPHLTSQLASAVKAGDPVSVRGYRAAAVSLVVAVSITDTRSGATVIDTGPPAPGLLPPPPPPGMAAPGAQQMTVQGKVLQPLHGPAGDVNGALLADGTIVRMPPSAAWQAASLLIAGQTLAVQGCGLTTAWGRVIDAQAVGTPGQMTQVSPGVPPSAGVPVAPGVTSPPQ
ncbi:hypothetical protein AWB80_07579 [Caballeronia pedi]|uniref:DUF5666 domain-containing protein n=1 Tax=Caballeronia pedi TaxID=1777141 RepID=A0A158DW32_9BURK|nr:hypothetical protein AWB80_07579 [Caballeronia pedi]